MSQTKGRVTIPTNLDVVPETIELMKRWGADYVTVMELNFRGIEKNGFMRLIIQQEKIMSGQRQIQMRCSVM